MNRYKFVSYLLILLGALVIGGASYLMFSYASDIFTAIVDFVTTNNISQLEQCGVTTPSQFAKIKADLTTVIVPFLYVGLPVLFILVSFLMFYAGFYYHRGKHEEEFHKSEEMEREMVHKIVKKMEAEKAPAVPPVPKQAPRSTEAQEEPDEEEPDEEPGEEEPEEPEEDEPEEPGPPSRPIKKRK